MSGLPFTQLVPAAARSAHAELLSALGTETNPAQWMSFMETVTRLLPDVLSSGRPTREAIQRSPIGQLGFASWSDMIEAPVDRNGLGWNFSAWKAWRRAWAVVEAHPWLRNQPMTSSEINVLAQECRRAGVDIPGSIEELDALRSAKQRAQAAKRAESVTDLVDRLTEAQRAARAAESIATAARAEAEGLREAMDRAIERAEEASLRAGVLTQQLAQAEEQRAAWERKARELAAQKQPQAQKERKLSRWQHLVRALVG